MKCIDFHLACKLSHSSFIFWPYIFNFVNIFPSHVICLMLQKVPPPVLLYSKCVAVCFL